MQILGAPPQNCHQKLYRRGSEICVLPGLPGGSVACSSLGTRIWTLGSGGDFYRVGEMGNRSTLVLIEGKGEGEGNENSLAHLHGFINEATKNITF